MIAPSAFATLQGVALVLSVKMVSNPRTIRSAAIGSNILDIQSR